MTEESREREAQEQTGPEARAVSASEQKEPEEVVPVSGEAPAEINASAENRPTESRDPQKSMEPSDTEDSKESEEPAPESQEPEDSQEPPETEMPPETQESVPDEPKESESPEKTEAYYRGLAEKVEQLVEMTDWAYVSMELANVEMLWEDGPDPQGVEIAAYRSRIDDSRKAFEVKKEAHYEEQKRVREENLEKKKALLEELKQIIDNSQWTATREVGRIRNRWDQIKPLPSGKAEELQKKYDAWLTEFENHKVDRIVRKKEKEEENLVGKLLILDKMDLVLKLAEESPEQVDWPEKEGEMESLSRQWYKIGRVPPEKNQETWERFHKAQQRFHDLRFGLDKDYRVQIENYLKKKMELIHEAEALHDSDDLPSASRRVNKLHRLWKKAGNLPQKEENELWDRFKGATDRFNSIKTENIDKLREQEQENLEQRQELIRRAEELQDSEEWEEAHSAYQKLMEQWKSTGPVPKRSSGKVWKKFKKAMDHFYDRRREHFRTVRKKRKNNLDEKREVMDKLRELAAHENPVEAVELAKPLQEEFKKAGYVPVKFKNQIWKEYREVCDEIYGRFRAARSAADLVGAEEVSEFSGEEIDALRKHQREAARLSKEISKLNDELIQMKESLTYFKPSGSGSSLLDSLHEKLSGLEDKITKKEERLDRVEREIDQLGRQDG